jgi:hypothetical protein
MSSRNHTTGAKEPATKVLEEIGRRMKIDVVSPAH